MPNESITHGKETPVRRKWNPTNPRWFRRLALAGILVGVVLGCAATPPMAGVEERSWAGRVGGMITGPLTLALRIGQADDAGRARPVSGSVMITMEKTAGGYGQGEIKALVRGVIADGVLDADFKGHAFVADGHTSVAGRLEGALGDDAGRGRWTMHTPSEAGNLSGDWVLQRVR